MPLPNEKLERAIEEYDFCIKLDPRSDRAFYARGVAKYKLGRLEEALQDFDKAIELYSYYAEAYYLRSIIKEALNLNKEAERDFARACEIDPTVKEYVDKKIA